MGFWVFFLLLFLGLGTAPGHASVFVDDVINFPDGQYQVKIEGKPIFAILIKTPRAEIKILATSELKRQGPKIPHALYALYAGEIQQFFDEVKSELDLSYDDLPRELADIWSPEEVALGQNFKKQLEHIEQFYVPKSGDAAKEVALSGDPVLVVTHASQIFDKGAKTKAGLDHLVAQFKRQESPVVFIMSDDQLYDFTWLSDDRLPTLAIFSRNGDHHLKLDGKKVYLAGGYFSLCLNRTLNRIAAGGASRIKIYLPMTAIYEDVYFWPIEHLKGAALLRAQTWKFGTPVTPTLYEAFQHLGGRAIIDGTKTLLSMLPKNFSISIAIDGNVLYRRGASKRKIHLEFLSTTAP
ncbi:MAG: hypothetical protein A2X86_21835 [Bdellovibrionales bacterium GWA2_49_15]|nr:MAG: hypothetical protein A2X86_21835 [Bdellovibrionales bacterium GWA2_49_15]HAZ12856.1 hypothetical protein [Bdellovibrionales bacterium]